MLRGLTIQIQVVSALILRETKTRFGKHKLGYLWALFQPIVQIGIFSAMFYFGGRHLAAGMEPISFLTSGFMPFMLFGSVNSSVTTSIDANRGLLFYPRVRPLDLVFARIILEFATFACVAVVLLTAAALLEKSITSVSAIHLASGLVLSAALGSGLGLVVCGLAVFYPVTLRLIGPALRPLFWISGIFFSVNSLPSALRHLFLYNPVLHCVEVFRSGVFPQYHAQGVTPWFPAVVALCLWFFGLTLERVARQHVQSSV